MPKVCRLRFPKCCCFSADTRRGSDVKSKNNIILTDYVLTCCLLDIRRYKKCLKYLKIYIYFHLMHILHTQIHETPKAQQIPMTNNEENQINYDANGAQL